jgi:beta-lactamase superfamily II metal-dependent hydrolase
MQVNFINVGYGDSILIEYKHNNGKFIILIDGGKPDEDHYKNFPGRIRTVDFLREKRIDKINLMVVSHLHEDHVGGLLEVVRNYEVDEMWSNFVFPDELLGRKIDFVCGYDEGASRLLNALNIYNQICCTMTKSEN